MRIALAAALLALAACRADTGGAKADLPELYVLTSLPLLFDEGFAAGPATGEAAVFLRAHYRLRPIDLPSQLPPRATLLAAQPRALPAEELVALDKWVRGGGRMLLLADPMLEWPSERALGDRLRPPMAYADTGLLAHWGLRLDAPDVRGVKAVSYEGFELVYDSPGTLKKMAGECSVEQDARMASCTLGSGRAVVVADSDLLDEEDLKRKLGRNVANLGAVGFELELLSGRRPK